MTGGGLGGDFNGRGPQCVYVIKAKITVSWLQVDWNNNKGNDNDNGSSQGVAGLAVCVCRGQAQHAEVEPSQDPRL